MNLLPNGRRLVSDITFNNSLPTVSSGLVKIVLTTTVSATIPAMDALAVEPQTALNAETIQSAMQMASAYARGLGPDTNVRFTQTVTQFVTTITRLLSVILPPRWHLTTRALDLAKEPATTA